MDTPEFKIGKTVTLDRYNHVDDAERVKVVGYGTIGWGEGERLSYKLDVKGTIISSTGKCIKESKNYDPVPDEERHHKIGIGTAAKEKFWDKVLGRNK
jgi:hypothetical protein